MDVMAQRSYSSTFVERLIETAKAVLDHLPDDQSLAESEGKAERWTVYMEGRNYDALIALIPALRAAVQPPPYGIIEHEEITDMQLMARIRKLGFTVPFPDINPAHPERHARNVDVIWERYVEVYGVQPPQGQTMRVCGLEE